MTSPNPKSRALSNTLPNLGELELQILNLLWDQSATGLSAKNIHTHLASNSGLNTIQSALERLYRKHLLSRHKDSHAFLYTAALQRHELTSAIISSVIERLQVGSLEPVLNSFVDFAEGIDDNTLNRLERLIQERKRERAGNND
ncbi:MAG: putative transcriptional regulator [Bacteroidia bacterium]|jgi:predicted transcriptional regulator